MLRIKLALGCALAILVSLSLGTAYAQGPANQLTYFTFSAPFELPGGKTLPAGKYVFKIVDSPSNRHVVQIFNEDQTQIFATVLAIPAQRMEPPDEPEVRFMETAANQPPAIRTWWYPGRTIGHEFIYPKEHALRLAAREAEPVLTVATDATTTETMQTADLARVDRTGAESVWTATENVAAEVVDKVEDVADAAIDTTRRAVETVTDTTATTTRTMLPRTATALPLIGLLGLGSLVGAGALRLRRR